MLVGISIITFTLSRLVPGDPARLMAGMNASEAQVENIRIRLGLDRPLPEQYLTYMNDLLHGDLGMSIMNGRPVSENLRLFFPATIELTVAAFLLATLVGVPLGVISALRKDSWIDHVSRVAALTGIAFPSFWLGLVLILIFFFYLGWLPAGHRADLMVLLNRNAPPITGFLFIDAILTRDRDLFASGLNHIILPAITLAVGAMARFTRFTRSVMLEETNKDYVRTARAKGLKRASVVRRHTLRNALLPTVTMMGLAVGYMLGGSVLVETIFNWPGIGQYAYDAIFNLDYPSILGATLVATVAFLLTNLVVDIIYAYLDPRIEYK